MKVKHGFFLPLLVSFLFKALKKKSIFSNDVLKITFEIKKIWKDNPCKTPLTNHFKTNHELYFFFPLSAVRGITV